MNKICTDISQSKVLSKILRIESADMWYVPIKRNEKVYYDLTIHCSLTRGIIPAWSLSALLNVLPYPQLSKDKLGSGKEGWMVSVYPNDCRYDSCWHDNPIDACVEMALKLYEQKLL